MAPHKSRRAPSRERSQLAPASPASVRPSQTPQPVVEEGDRLRPLLDHLHQLIDQIKTERHFLETVLQQMPAGVMIADAPSGRLRMGNEQVERIWRMPFISSKGIQEYSEWKAFHLDGRRYLPEEWPMARAVTRGEYVTGEPLRILRGDGSFGVISCNAAPIRDSKGNIVAGVVAFTDITQQVQARDELQRQAQIIDQVHDSIVRTNLEGQITGWNAGSERMFGYPASEALDQHLSFIYPREDRRFLQEKILKPLLLKGNHEADVRLRNKAGDTFFGHLSLSLLRDRKGVPSEIIGYTLDITDRKRAEEAVLEKDARLRLVQKAGSVGYWELNLESGDVSWAEETYKLMGRDPDTFKPTYQAFLDGVHPDDREWVNNAVTEAIEQKKEYDIEFRYIWPDGTVRWIATRGRAFYTGGKPLRMFGVGIDVTERHRRNHLRVRKLMAKPAEAEAAS